MQRKYIKHIRTLDEHANPTGKLETYIIAEEAFNKAELGEAYRQGNVYKHFIH